MDTHESKIICFIFRTLQQKLDLCKRWRFFHNQQHQRSFQLAYTLLIACILYQALVSIQFVLGKRKHIVFFAEG